MRFDIHQILFKCKIKELSIVGRYNLIYKLVESVVLNNFIIRLFRKEKENMEVKQEFD